MYEQEPTVNDILSSIRQILSNKIEDGNNEAVPSNVVNETVANTADEQEQALMQATDVFVLMPDMRVPEEEASHSIELEKNVSPQQISSNDMPYGQPMSFDEKEPIQLASVSERQIKSQTQAVPDMPSVQEADVKPMIQEWLDKNLPALVERIVAEEVRRIFNKR